MTSIATALMGLFILGTPQAGWSAGNPAGIITQLPSYEVTVTAYNAVPGQTDDDPFTTASGAYSNPDIVAARSVDLADELPFGTVIDIEPTATSSPNCGYDVVGDQIGLRVVADSMNPRMHNKVDILFDGHKSARTLGVCKNMKVTVVGHVDIAKMPKSQIELKVMLGKAGLALAK